MDKSRRKLIRKELDAKQANPKTVKEVENTLSGGNLTEYQKWQKRIIKTKAENQKIKNAILNKKAQNRCYKLGAACLKEIQDKGLKFGNEDVIPIVNKYEKQWHSYLKMKRIEPTDESKDMFVNMLVDYQQSITKENKETTKICSFKKAEFEKATKPELVTMATELNLKFKKSIYKDDLKALILKQPNLEIL